MAAISLNERATAILIKANTRTPEPLYKMDAYWRAVNYLSVG